MAEQWPTLTPGEYNKLERAGIVGCAEFVNLIELFGLKMMGDGNFYFPSELAPTLRMVGPKRWSRYLAMLDSIGFDWKAHIVHGSRGSVFVGPTTKDALYDILNVKIDELIRLLRQYQA